jgi:hypothetical protein
VFTAIVISSLVIRLKYYKCPTDYLYRASPAWDDTDKFGSNEFLVSAGIHKANTRISPKYVARKIDDRMLKNQVFDRFQFQKIIIFSCFRLKIIPRVLHNNAI